MNLVIGLVLAIISATSVPRVERPAAAMEKIPVFVQSEVHDQIGALYVAKFRDAIAQSNAYRPVTDPATARFVVGVLTMDPNEAESTTGSLSTVAAVTLQRENSPGLNQLVYSWVMVAKRDKLDSLVTELVAAIDREIKDLEPKPVVLMDDPSSLK